MRGTVAKRLRSRVYGSENSKRNPEKYVCTEVNPNTKICTGFRKQYLELKKQHKNKK